VCHLAQQQHQEALSSKLFITAGACQIPLISFPEYIIIYPNFSPDIIHAL